MDKSRTTNPFYHYQDLWKSDHFKKWERSKGEEFAEYRRQWQECPVNRKPPKFPLSINIEIINICNAQEYCVMCPKHFLHMEQKIMPLEDVKSILEEARKGGAYAVNLNGAGESLLHPNFLEIVQYAKELGYLDIMVHSNGTMLTEEYSRKLIESGLTRLIVSIDSHIPEIYEKIRPSFSFEEVYRNVKRFIEIREEMGKIDPVVRITIVVMKHNVDTVRECLDFWRFADYITINDCMYFDEYKVFEFDKEKIDEEAKEKGYIYVCSPLYQQLTVTIDKKVISCSTIYAKNNFQLGDLDQESLKDIWEGEKIAQMRKSHEDGNCRNISCCDKCDLPQIELLKKMKKCEGVMLS